MADSKKNLENQKLSNKELEKKLELEKEENRLLRRKLDYETESLDLSSSLVDSMKETLGIQTKRTTYDSNLLKINKQINSTILDQKYGLKDIDGLTKQISKNQDLIAKAKKVETSLEKSLSVTSKSKVNDAKKITNSININQRLLDKELEKAAEGKGYNEDRVKFLQDSIALKENDLDKEMKGMSSQQQQLLFSKLNKEQLEKVNKQREEELAHLKEIEGKLGAFGGILKGISKIPLVGDLVDTDEILKSARNTIDETGSGVMGLASGLKTAGKQMVSGILNPANLALAAMTSFVTQLILADKESGEVAKNMGISYHDALELGGEMLHVSQTSKDILVTQNGLLKAQADLNEYFGTGAKFSGEIAEEFTSIQTRTGLSNKAMGFFTRTAMKSGKEVKSVLTDITKTVQEQNSLNKISLSLKQVQEEIAKTSNAFQLTVKGSVQELTKAVFASKKLGASMEQIEGIASSLLDFESSIEAELQAELLLGKDINLEKARQFALEGKMGKVAEEVLKNKAIMNAFENNNVIQQEAAAKALGMSRSELADMVMEQQNLKMLQDQFGDGVTDMASAQAKYNKLKDEGKLTEEQINALSEQGLADQMASASQAEKFAGVVARIQTIFVAMAEPVLAIVDGVLNMVGGAENLAPLLKGIVGTMVIYKGLQTSIGILQAFQTAETVKELALEEGKIVLKNVNLALENESYGVKIASYILMGRQLVAEKLSNAYSVIKSVILKKNLLSSIGTAAVDAVSSLSKIPVIGWVLGMAAAASTVALGMKFMSDGIIGPGGEMVVSSPKGSIQLDKDDSIVAGTNLGGNKKPTSSQEKNTIPISSFSDKIVEAINTQNQLLERLAGRKIVVEMDGNQVGQSLNVAERSLQ